MGEVRSAGLARERAGEGEHDARNRLRDLEPVWVEAHQRTVFGSGRRGKGSGEPADGDFHEGTLLKGARDLNCVEGDGRAHHVVDLD